MRTDRVVHLWGPAATDEVTGSPELVVVPSYWGRRRFETLGPEAVTLAEALLALEEPVKPVSFLVEVEPGRVCVSYLDFDGGTVAGTLMHHDGRPSDIVLRFLEQTGERPEDCEFIVAAGPRDPMIADLWRRGLLAFPVPRDRLGRSAPAPVPVTAEPEEDGLGITEIRARLRSDPVESRGRVVSPLTAVAAVAVLIAVGAVTWLGFQRAGPEVVAAEATTSTPVPLNPEPDLVERRGDGFLLAMPETWDIVPEAVEGMLVLHDGGEMRVLATASERAAQTLDLDVVERVAVEDPEVDLVRREHHDGVGFVVHEERPGDGSVVLWHHRVENGRQISVGCQYRGAGLPQTRPLCTGAVTSMRLT